MDESDYTYTPLNPARYKRRLLGSTVAFFKPLDILIRALQHVEMVGAPARPVFSLSPASPLRRELGRLGIFPPANDSEPS